MRKRVREQENHHDQHYAPKQLIERTLFLTPVLVALNKYLDFKTIWYMSQLNRRFYYKWHTKGRDDALQLRQRMEAWNHFKCGWNANPMNMFRKIAADTFNPVLIHDMKFICWECQRRRTTDRLANRQIFKKRTCLSCAYQKLGIKNSLKKSAIYKYQGYVLDRLLWNRYPEMRHVIQELRNTNCCLHIMEYPQLFASTCNDVLFKVDDLSEKGIILVKETE